MDPLPNGNEYEEDVQSANEEEEEVDPRIQVGFETVPDVQSDIEGETVVWTMSCFIEKDRAWKII